MGKKKRYFKMLKVFPPKRKCLFCFRSTADPSMLGDIYQISDIILHYFCLLSASNVEQNGTDDEGLLGFFPKDIKAELSRGENRKCRYCKKTGASVMCAGPNCTFQFHLPCGLENGSLHQYYGDFRSFCKKHSPRQKIPNELKKLKQVDCPICITEVTFAKEPYIWPACCKSVSVIHKTCCQMMALNAGYALKCPLCNNKEKFGAVVRKFGIYVPDQEASWEFDDGRNRLDDANTLTCIASFNDQCLCPRGPKYSLRTNKRWYIEVCTYCGSGMHLGCMSFELARNEEYICDSCATVKEAQRVDLAMEVEDIDAEIEEVDEEVARFRAAVGLDIPVEIASVRSSAESSMANPPRRIEEFLETIVISDSSDDECTPGAHPPPKRPALTVPRRPAITCPHYRERKNDNSPKSFFLITTTGLAQVSLPPSPPPQSENGFVENPPSQTEKGFVEIPPSQTDHNLLVSRVCSILPSEFALIGNESGDHRKQADDSEPPIIELDSDSDTEEEGN